jgi:uroporphyrinogen decarboxylase
MSEPLLRAALARRNTRRPPVWFMRQAGRYHHHYQALRARHEFIELCKDPRLATEVTLGPVRDFGFDAAILFSDLLFPLEAMGMGLRYAPGPQLDRHIRTRADVQALRGGTELATTLDFQGEALERLRAALPAQCTLIGFVGGPFTLYAYAAAGSHEGFARGGLPGLEDGVYAAFCERLVPLLAANMTLQARAGADCVALFDTAAGSLDPAGFAAHAAAPLAAVLSAFRAQCPQVPVIYYSRDTGPAHWQALTGLDLQCLGVDWHQDLAQVLNTQQRHWAVQGNIDPHWLLQPADALERRVRSLFEHVLHAVPQRQGWICGLGHGVLPGTPEDNVRLVLRLQREMFD